MGRKCSVADCPSDSNRPEDVGVTFHKLPMHPDVRPKWMALCRIPDDKKFIKIIYVCSRHFLRADFCNFKGKKYMLKQGVLPSVFPWDKSKLKAIKAEAVAKKEDVAPAIKQEIDANYVKQEFEEVKNEIGLDLDRPEESENERIQPTLTFTINSRIEALDFNNEWFPAKIIEVDYEENEVLIHFEQFSNKYDEWISMNSSRLRPLQPDPLKQVEKKAEKKICIDQYTVGERCLAAWSDNRKFPATVTKIMENDLYEVLFDDGFVKTLKAHRISKQLEGKMAQSSPLFEPIKSSKQDRREKKRKLNVADLFKKRAKMELSEEKLLKKSQVAPIVENIEPVLEIVTETDIQNWRPRWIKGKPVGIDATLDTADGPKHSTIVPDPRLPEGWKKHLLRRNQGTYAGKWDTIIVSPDNRRFRSKTDIRLYLEQNPIEGLNESMFCFSLVGNARRKKSNTTKKVSIPTKKPVLDTEVPLEPVINDQTETISPDVMPIKEEENPNSLKIVFEDNAYKCPIEGCGKNFRRENLALMHVKHYHPEYTKFLDSTPNVADLAYARTVGENLDRSPGPSKPPTLKPAVKTSTPKTLKSCNSPIPEIPDVKPAQSPSILPVHNKDTEIIKLLSSKPFDKNELEPIQPLPSGLPTNMYPDIKLKDLLSKTEGVPKRDDNLLKTLCMSRPPVGIKTLLPIVRTSNETPSANQVLSNEPVKRKRGYTESLEIIKGKERANTPTSKSQLPLQSMFQTQQLQQITTPHNPNLTSQYTPPSTTPDNPLNTVDSSSSQPAPPNDVIIEGGEVIKIVRMKQEEIINCTCGYMEEDGLMIQCELCLCWQHAYCNNIERESQVPDKYVCWICQNPFRERLSRKYYHDQEWLKQGVLPTGSYHSRDEETLKEHFEKLKKCHDLSGGLLELRDYAHSLGVKLKIAGAKNHPKLYLWSKSWEKKPLPEKIKDEHEDIKPNIDTEVHEYMKDELDAEKNEKQDNESMLMILLKGKEMPKLDLNSLMDNTSPIIPRPEAAIDSADCRLNLLDHIMHEESLLEQRLDDFEKRLDALEEGLDIEKEENYPKTRATVQMLLKDLDKLKEFSHSTTI